MPAHRHVSARPPGAASERRGGNAQPAELRVAGCEKIHREKPTAARGFSRSNCRSTHASLKVNKEADSCRSTETITWDRRSDRAGFGRAATPRHKGPPLPRTRAPQSA